MALCEIVMRLGWLDVSSVNAYVGEWLVQMDPIQRREGCHIVAGLRLADMQEDVRWVRDFDVLDIYGEAADEALRVLGATPED